MIARISLCLAALSLLLTLPACAKKEASCGDKEPSCSEHGEPAVAAVKDPAPAAAATATTAPATADVPGKVYGAGVSGTEPVAISRILAEPDAWEGKTVRVEGLVTDVCAKRGCWFNMAADTPGKTMRFKVKDGVMVFPMDAKGKYAVAEGTVRKIPLDLEQTRKVLAHEAEEKGEAFDPASVTEAITLVRLDGAGAVIRERK